MLCYFFLVIPPRVNFVCRRFGTVCPIFIGGVDKKNDWDEFVRGFILLAHTTYEDGTDRVFRNVGKRKIQTVGITRKKDYNVLLRCEDISSLLYCRQERLYVMVLVVHTVQC